MLCYWYWRDFFGGICGICEDFWYVDAFILRLFVGGVLRCLGGGMFLMNSWNQSTQMLFWDGRMLRMVDDSSRDSAAFINKKPPNKNKNKKMMEWMRRSRIKRRKRRRWFAAPRCGSVGRVQLTSNRSQEIQSSLLINRLWFSHCLCFYQLLHCSVFAVHFKGPSRPLTVNATVNLG